MIIIVGLGNPDQKFKDTPHNIGFQIIEEFQKENNFPLFSFSKKFQSQISEKKVNNKKVLLVRPQTFMNSSGKAVASLISFYKVRDLENLWIVHDDFDIALGKLKISKGRSSAGHKGVQSIIEELKNKNFVRFRIGIKPINNEQRTMNNINIEQFVLKKFSKKNEKVIKKVIKKTVEAIEVSLKKGLEKAMTEYNH